MKTKPSKAPTTSTGKPRASTSLFARAKTAPIVAKSKTRFSTCLICHKGESFCHCDLDVINAARAEEVLGRHEGSVRAKTLLEVADFVVGAAEEARKNGKRKRVRILLDLAESIALDRMRDGF